MFAGSRRGFDHRSIHLGCAMHWNNYPVHTCRLRAAQQRPEVVNILNSIEDKQKWVFISTVGVIDDLLKCSVLTRFNHRYTALVDCPLAQIVKSLARQRFDGNMPPFSLVQNSLDNGCITLPFCY